MEIALRLFTERGYASVTVPEICDAADIAVRTFYRYFPGKEDVLAQPIRALSDRVKQDLLGAPAQLTDTEAMHAALLTVGELIVADRAQMAQLFRVVRQPGAGDHPLLRLADREQELALALAKRRGDAADAADWRTRLTVARSNAAFRIWLTDLVEGRDGDPVAHLREILEAP